MVVDDDATVLRALERLLTSAARKVSTFTDPALAIDALAAEPAEVVLLDLVLPGFDGISLCERIRRTWPDTEVVVISGQGSIESAVAAMRAGAYDFVPKPFPSNNVVRRIVDRALERRGLVQRARRLERRVDLADRFERIVGRGARMRAVFSLAESVADTDATVLITGESGTGKELVARAIHDRSGRRSGPFVAVNCSALSDALLESELFGHVRGAFTGAVGARRGIFEEAEGGTVFLDEIGDTSASMQSRLLRVLQEGEVRPVGAAENRRVNVRVLCATNADLRARMREGRFREDLYYRIHVIRIELPPLRERTEDLPLLATHLIEKHAARLSRPARPLSASAVEALARHPWPGNVRELENVLARAVILTRTEAIEARDLGLEAPDEPATSALHSFGDRSFADAKRAATEAFERAYLREVLRKAEGNAARAAKMAGLDRSNFRRLLVRLGMGSDD